MGGDVERRERGSPVCVDYSLTDVCHVRCVEGVSRDRVLSIKLSNTGTRILVPGCLAPLTRRGSERTDGAEGGTIRSID